MSSVNEQTSSTGFGEMVSDRKRKADDSEMEQDRPYLPPIKPSQMGSKKKALDVRRGRNLESLFLIKAFNRISHIVIIFIIYYNHQIMNYNHQIILL